MHKVSVIVVSGFVGAGKTTLVGHLVQELGPARTAVMAEAGSVWVPEEVEANLSCDRHGARDPCSFRRRLADAIMEAARFGRCETILIENSGGTDPLLVANLFEAHTPDGDALSMVARLDHLITVIDAERFWLDYESGNTLGERGVRWGPDRDQAVAELLADQVECATALVLNKCDRVTKDERLRLERFLRLANPDAALVTVSSGGPGSIASSLPAGGSSDIKPGWMQLLSGDLLADHQCALDGLLVYRAKRPFHPMRFWQFIQDEWPGVLRSKGYFWIASQPKTCYMWSQAGANCLYERLGRWWVAIPDRHWPKGEGALEELRKVWDLEFGDRRIELAFIGEHMDRSALTRRLDECLLTRDELCLEEELWRAFRDPFKKASWEKRHGRSEWRHR